MDGYKPVAYNSFSDIENSREYKAHDFIVIPARVPHVFEFLEDNYLLEWWGDDFRAWFYRYIGRI